MQSTTKAIIFKNFSDEDFTHTWDSVPYTFKAGQEIFMEDWKALHFAKHLVQRELNKLNRPTNDPSRIGLMKKCMPTAEAIVASDQSSLQTELLNVDHDSDKLNDSMPKKNNKPENEFEGLKGQRKLGRPKKVDVVA